MRPAFKFAEQAFAGSGPCALARPPRGLLGTEWELVRMSGDSELGLEGRLLEWWSPGEEKVRDRVNRVGIVRNIIRGGSDPPSLPPRGPNQRAIWSRTRAKPGANGSAKRVVATRRPPKERRSGERNRLRHRHVDGISSKRRTRGWTQRVGGEKNADAVGDATGSRAGPQSAEPPTQASHLVQTPGGPSPGIRRLVSNSDGFGFIRRPLRRWVAGMDDAWSKQGEEGWPEGGACVLLPSPSEIESPSLSGKKVATATPSFPNKYQLGRITSAGQSTRLGMLVFTALWLGLWYVSFTASFSVTRIGVYACLYLCAISTGQSLVDSYRCPPKVAR
ncbi:hypothetical protein BHM03_00002247 [Ensete ventricosum]|nr:hypothetical protein BHM03_00002247 [Ensete ventricosum]